SLRALFGCPDTICYELPPEAPVTSGIFFQTRLWQPDSTSDDAEQINLERVTLVRALREAFGTAFIGGMIPTEYAARCFPDTLTTHPTDRWSYIDLNKRSLIGIYARGLHGSIAFKMAEYLAASKCI